MVFWQGTVGHSWRIKSAGYNPAAPTTISLGPDCNGHLVIVVAPLASVSNACDTEWAWPRDMSHLPPVIGCSSGLREQPLITLDVAGRARVNEDSLSSVQFDGYLVVLLKIVRFCRLN